MSMNLCCINKKTRKEINLRQTSTNDSYRIYNHGNGGSKGVIDRYEEYLKQNTSWIKNAYKRKLELEEIEHQIKLLKDEVADLEFFVN